MKRLKKFLIALTSIFNVISLFSLSACNATTHTLTLVNENEDYGTLTGEGSYKAGSQVTISYTANKGYKFDKWDIDGEEIKISSKAYTFKMPNKDITVKGSFIPKQYKVSISHNGNCQVLGEGSHDYNSEVTVTCTPDTGYAFTGWYDKGSKEIVSNDSTYTFKMPNHDVELEPYVSIIKYSLTVVCSNPENVNITLNTQDIFYNSELVLFLSTKSTDVNENYKVTGIYLYNNGVIGEKISDNNVFLMPDHDLTIYVQVERAYFFYSALIDDEKCYNTKWCTEGEKITLKTKEVEYFDFIGWYESQYGEFISSDLEFTFTMPPCNQSLVARYEFNDDLIKFGEYQQSAVMNPSLIAELEKIDTVNSKGYIEYEGEEYFKDTSSLNHGYYKYFKVEPIKWIKINEFSDGTSLLLCLNLLLYDQIQESDLTSGSFNYMYSSFRENLNNTFYENAFSSEEKNMIRSVTIENLNSSKIVSDDRTGDYYIKDKVFIPCREDLNLPIFDTPFGDILFSGLTTEYSSCHTDYNVHYLNGFFKDGANLSVSLLRDIQDGKQLLCDNSFISIKFLKNIVGEAMSLRPMIFVKGL